uniref:B30.2/SPRY domain-containing protein n=1 Tax=Acrobeloides nanus TaxID=290746 RepID=A0A914ECQ1_9BILA
MPIRQSTKSDLVISNSQPNESFKTNNQVVTNGRKYRKRSNSNNCTSTTIKKSKLVVNNINADVNDEFPYNCKGYRYYPVEKDRVNRSELFDDSNYVSSCSIPPHLYRLKLPSYVSLSPNDKENKLKLGSDLLTITGNEGYSTALATHSVSHGKWYYEVEFLRQPPVLVPMAATDTSHIRIGWAQIYDILQAPIGYTKFSYSWRSKFGTIFHEGKGKHYMNLKEGFREGDVLGCLIDLPSLNSISREKFSQILPSSHKDSHLIRSSKCQNRYSFAERHGDLEMKEKLQSLKSLEGSRIEFFKNGKSCGTAFTNIYSGSYFPAVSLYYQSKIKCNFGPVFKFSPPHDAKAMCERAVESIVEQTVTDLLYFIENEEEIEKKNADYLASLTEIDETVVEQFDGKL